MTGCPHIKPGVTARFVEVAGIPLIVCPRCYSNYRRGMQDIHYLAQKHGISYDHEETA